MIVYYLVTLHFRTIAPVIVYYLEILHSRTIAPVIVYYLEILHFQTDSLAVVVLDCYLAKLHCRINLVELHLVVQPFLLLPLYR